MYTRVSYEQRCQISAYLQAKISIPEIAKQLGFHKTTIYREIKRNSKRGIRSFNSIYTPLEAEKLAKKRYKNCKRRTVIKGDIEKVVRSGLREGWSPEQVAGRLTKEKVLNVSHETIYRFVRNNPEMLPCLKWHKKRGYGRYRQRKAKPDWIIGIKHRPKIANERRRIGDWERDTMYVKDRKTVLVLTDRKTRYVKICPLKTHTAKEVAIQTKALIDSTGKRAFTVTNDNGGEFRWNGDIGFKIFWCDPHAPQQRGTVENTIGLLRKYIKRNTDIDDIDFERIERTINLRPRKVLNYSTPYEIFYKKKVALGI